MENSWEPKPWNHQYLDIEGHWPANGWECPRLSKVCPWPTVVQPHILPVDLSWCRLWILVDLMATFQGTLGHEFGRCSNRYMIWHMTKVFSLGWMMPIQSRSSNLDKVMSLILAPNEEFLHAISSYPKNWVVWQHSSPHSDEMTCDAANTEPLVSKTPQHRI